MGQCFTKAKCIRMDREIPTRSDKREGRGKSRPPIHIHHGQQCWGPPCLDSGKPTSDYWW
jgi:hypothetical protein